MGAAPILIIGETGQLGRELVRLGGDDVRGCGPILDLADADSVSRVLARHSFGAIINAAAYTAVDRAEGEPIDAWAANALGPAILASHAAKRDVPLLHVSTDYVFSGDQGDCYRETDPVRPLGVYGASKEGGEQAVRAGAPRHAIVRTAWLASAHGNNFVTTMLRLAETRDTVRVVGDQHGSPTSATDLANALLAMARRMMAEPETPSGTWHFVNSGEASWDAYARHIFAESRLRGGPFADVVSIPTSEYPTPARRPANSRLATALTMETWGLKARPWQVAIAEIVASLVTPSTVQSAPNRETIS